MSKELSLGKLTLLYSIGNFASKVISLLLFFVYTYYLSKENIGYFDLLLTTVGWITPIVSLQVSESVLRWTISSKDDHHRVATGSIVSIAINTTIFIALFFIASYFYEFNHKYLIAIFIIVQTIYPVILQFARGTGNNRIYVISGVLYSALYTFFSLLGIITLNLKIEGLIIANILAVLFTVAYLSWQINFLKFINFRKFDLSFTKEMLKYSIPLIPNTLSWWAISTIDRYVVLVYLGASSNGLFAVGMKFPTILLMITNIFGMAWQEKGIKSFNDENRNSYYSNIFDKYFTGLFTLIILLICSTKLILHFVVPDNYYEVWTFIPFLYFAVGFQALSAFYGVGYIGSKNTKGALETTIYGVVVAIVLNLILVPRIGLLGSSISMFAGYFCMFIVRLYKTKVFFQITLPIRKMVILGGTCILVTIINLTGNIYILFANCFIGAIVFFTFNIGYIIEIKNKYKHSLR